MRHGTIELALGKAGADDTDVRTFAAGVAAATRKLLDELAPIVGNLATHALYVRTLHLARSSFKPPEAARPETLEALLATLEQDLASRQPADAGRAGRALLQSLVDLLFSLIGEHLTHRMLRKAWGIPASELPFEEKPQ